MDLLVNIVPHNIVGAMADDKQKLGIVFFALMIGIGLVMPCRPPTRAFKNALHGLFEICMHLIGMFIRWPRTPSAASCSASPLQLGWDDGPGRFVVTVLVALAIHGFVVLPLWVRFMGGMSPRVLPAAPAGGL